MSSRADASGSKAAYPAGSVGSFTGSSCSIGSGTVLLLRYQRKTSRGVSIPNLADQINGG
jgi:hypothetical protein